MSNCKECIIASVGLTGKKDCPDSCMCSCHKMTLHDIEILEIHNKIEKIQKDVILIKKYLDRQDVQLDSWYQHHNLGMGQFLHKKLFDLRVVVI